VVPFADNLDCIFLSSLLVCAASTDGEATLSKSTILQVHLITHVERRVLHRGTVDQNKFSGHLYTLIERCCQRKKCNTVCSLYTFCTLNPEDPKDCFYVYTVICSKVLLFCITEKTRGLNRMQQWKFSGLKYWRSQQQRGKNCLVLQLHILYSTRKGKWSVCVCVFLTKTEMMLKRFRHQYCLAKRF